MTGIKPADPEHWMDDYAHLDTEAHQAGQAPLLENRSKP